jgi:hypothetical protein
MRDWIAEIGLLSFQAKHGAVGIFKFFVLMQRTVKAELLQFLRKSFG